MFRPATALGAATALLALAGVILAAFGPATFLYPPPGADVRGTDSLFAQDALTAAFFVWAVVSLIAAIGVWLTTALRAAGGSAWPVWIALLVLAACSATALPGGSTMVVPTSVAATIPDSMGIGLYLVPAVLIGLVAAVAATASHAEVSRPAFQ
jgi:magnesium-transporting ATPase (P-type)